MLPLPSTPQSISQGEALSRDNRKQVLRAGRWWRAAREDGRTAGKSGLQVCRTEEIGDGGIWSKKMQLHRNGLPKMEVSQTRMGRCGDLRSWQSVRRERHLAKGRAKMTEMQGCGSRSINSMETTAQMPSCTFTEAHLQVEMVSCPTQTLLHPNPHNYTQYSTCVSTHVQHHS